MEETIDRAYASDAFGNMILSGDHIFFNKEDEIIKGLAYEVTDPNFKTKQYENKVYFLNDRLDGSPIPAQLLKQTSFLYSWVLSEDKIQTIDTSMVFPSGFLDFVLKELNKTSYYDVFRDVFEVESEDFLFLNYSVFKNALIKSSFDFTMCTKNNVSTYIFSKNGCFVTFETKNCSMNNLLLISLLKISEKYANKGASKIFKF